MHSIQPSLKRLTVKMFEKKYTLQRNEKSLDSFRTDMTSEINTFFQKHLINEDKKGGTGIQQLIKLNEEVIAYFELAVYEIIINIIDHSTIPPDFSPEISAYIHVDENKIKATIEYYAEEFDFTSEKLPALKKHFSEGKSRGLGLYIIRTLMDNYSYNFENFRNSITIEKLTGI